MEDKYHAHRVQIERLRSQLALKGGTNLSNCRQDNVTESIEQEEIDHLRSKLGDLQRLESGLSSGPPARPVKDFTVTEQSSAPNKPTNNAFVSYAVGLASVLGIVLAIVAIAKSNTPNNQEPGAPPSQGIPPPQGELPPIGNEVVSFSELALHNEPDDCWVALHGSVYDLTSYAKRHPAGAGIITRLAGTDGTSEYARFHSEPLLASVQADIVGILDLETVDNADNEAPEEEASDNEEASVEDLEPPANGCSPQDDSTCVSIQDLASHNTADDCWVAIHGNVFDLTKYALVHPAGALVVTQLAGTDGTNEYHRFHGEALLFGVQDHLIGPYEGGVEPIDEGGIEMNSDSSEDRPRPNRPRPPRPTPPAPSPTPSPMEAASGAVVTIITMDVLAQHRTADDAWLALHGNVYDLTEYAPNHPVGPSWITDLAGTDGTSEFDKYHDPTYLPDIEEFMVGRLAGAGDGATGDGINTPGNPNPPQDPGVPPADNGGITLDVLAQHNNENDLWVAFYGIVYDLTRYDHPGGAFFITDVAGTDGTARFDRFHGQDLHFLDDIKQYIVGPLAGATGGVVGADPPPADPILPPPPEAPGVVSGCAAGDPDRVTIAELAEHNRANNCWVAYHGGVYDMTNYARDHPGGRSPITQVCGIDGTSAYARLHRPSLLNRIRSSTWIGTFEGGGGSNAGNGGEWGGNLGDAGDADDSNDS